MASTQVGLFLRREKYYELKQGRLLAGRQGHHMPGVPTESWNGFSPFDTGLRSAGISLYATPSDLIYHQSTMFRSILLSRASGSFLEVRMDLGHWKFDEWFFYISLAHCTDAHALGMPLLMPWPLQIAVFC